MAKDPRKSTGNLFRLFGYSIEGIAVLAWLSSVMYVDPDAQPGLVFTLNVPEGGSLNTFTIVVLSGFIIGCALIIAGNFVKFMPKSEDELRREWEARNQEQSTS